METTLYNHKKVGSDDKPLIPNIIYKSLLTLLEHKDYEACEYILNCYTLTPYQLYLYELIFCLNK